MELMAALEFLQLKEIPDGWVDTVWDVEFTESEPLYVGVEDEISRAGPKAFLRLYKRLLPYATEDGASSESVWTVFGENGVSAKSLVAVLSYFVLGGKPKTAGFTHRLAALQAAALYLLLLGIPAKGREEDREGENEREQDGVGTPERQQEPGSVANKVFHQILFDSCLGMSSHCWPQSCNKKRKKDTQASQAKRPKSHRKENDGSKQTEMDEDEEEEEEVHLSPHDLVKIREGVVLLVQTLLRLLQKFTLKDKPQSHDSCVQVFVKLTDFEPVSGELRFGGRLGREVEDMETLPELAYHGLNMLCSAQHGDEKESLRQVFRRLLYVILMMNKGQQGRPSLLTPSQAVLTHRDHTLSFVCHLVDEVKEAVMPLLRTLLQHICCQMAEKAEYRGHGAQAVARLLGKMPSEDYAAFIKWLFGYSRNAKVNYRMFGLDVAMALLEQEERPDGLAPELAIYLPHRFLVQNLLFGRRSDASPSVRAHSLTCLAQCLELPSLPASRTVYDLFSSTGARTVLDSHNGTGSQTPKGFRTMPFRTVEITNNVSASFESKETMDLLHCRVSDPKTNVRKSALQAMSSLLKHGVITLSQENLAVLSERCRDPAVSVKKKALQSLGELLIAQPESTLVQKAWLGGVVPAVVDTESSVHEKALECLDQVILSQVKRHASHTSAPERLTWALLGLLCEDCKDLSRYLSKAFPAWSRQNRFTPAFISSLISHTEAPHAAGAWLLLAKVASSSPKLNYAKILEAWDDMVRTKSVSVTTSCNILSVIGDIAQHLNDDTKSRIVEDLMTWLKSLEMPLEVISASVETLCRLGQEEAVSDTQKFLNQYCGELVAVCEAYLSDVLLNENGAQNLNEDLVMKHLFTLGVASLHCPAKVGRRLVLLVQSVLTCTADQQTAGPGELPASQPPSQPLSQFRPNSMPSGVRAHAVLTLGKLCLQHEDLTQRYLPAFARELELGSEVAARGNVVVVMCDLCVRYTNMVDRYVPNISACLQDREPLIREQTLTMLTNLLQEDYVKWKGSLFFRFVAVLVDEDPAIAKHCEYCLVHLLLKKNPVMFSQHFIECIFHFNSYHQHKTYNKFPQTDSEKARFSLRGIRNQDRRFQIYRFLLENFTDVERFNTTIKICQTVLACFVDEELPLDSEGQDLLLETLGVLSLKEIRLQSASGPAEGGEEPEDEQQVAMKVVMQAAQKKLQKKMFIENIIPIFIALKSMLEQRRSPVLKGLMGYLQVTMQDYRSEVKELFAADDQLASELEYNLQLYDKEQEGLDMEKQLAGCSLEMGAAGAKVSVQSPVPAHIARAFFTPQPLRTHQNLLTPRVSQSVRQRPLSSLVLQQRNRRMTARNPDLTRLRDSVIPKGAGGNRAISTPQAKVNDVTFGEGISCIMGDRSRAESREHSHVLHLVSPDKEISVPKWNVQSPLNQKRTRRQM